MDKYLKALKQNVCSICADSTEKGACTLNNNETCAVELFFPQIINVVHNSKSEKYSDLKNELRNNICAKCRAGEKDSCALRDDANCSLDRYFPFIAEVIRKVDAGKL